MSAAVEAAADEPFLTFMRKQIFEPLGMDRTEPDLATEAGPIARRPTSRGSRRIPATAPT